MVKKVLKYTKNIITFIFLCIAILFVTSSIIGVNPYITMSGSMEPKIKTGSVCFVDTNIEYNEVKKNDIIAFKANDNTLVTHRVVNITQDGVETKGDNNEVADMIQTNESNYVGKTIFSIPYVGYGIGYMQKPINKIFICIAAFTLLSLSIVDIIYPKDKK